MNGPNIGLEPRLIEYLKQRKFYEENNINTDTTCLEKQYLITENDWNEIYKYKAELNKTGLNKTGLNKAYNRDADLIDFTKSKFKMANMYDARLERINEKVKRERDAKKYKYNTTILQKTYDMYSNDFSSAASDDFSNEFSLDNIRDEMRPTLKQSYEANSNFNTHELISPPSRHQYHNPPVIQRDQTQPFKRLDNQFNKIGSGYSKSYEVPPNIQKVNTFDTDNKITIPANNCRKNDLNTSFNEFNEFNTAENIKNIDYENYVKYGCPTSKARSLGFENASKHFFQFIDSDIQDPRHVVSDRPVLTRLDNKAAARSKQRDIY